MADQILPLNQDIKLVVHEIGDLLAAARSNVARQVNNELLSTYWNIGRIIAEYEQTVPERADYGKQTLKELSKALTAEFGKGFSRANLQNMRSFYLTYEKCQTLSGKLSWSHYCELLSISDPDKRSFYEKEAVNSNWSVRELKRQIDSSLFERLLLSRGDANKEQLIAQVEAVLKKRDGIESDYKGACFWQERVAGRNPGHPFLPFVLKRSSYFMVFFHGPDVIWF